MIAALLLVIASPAVAPVAWRSRACNAAFARMRSIATKAGVRLGDVDRSATELRLSGADPHEEETLQIVVSRVSGAPHDWKRTVEAEARGEKRQVVRTTSTRAAQHTVEIDHAIGQATVHDDKRHAFAGLDELERAFEACATSKDTP